MITAFLPLSMAPAASAANNRTWLARALQVIYGIVVRGARWQMKKAGRWWVPTLQVTVFIFDIWHYWILRSYYLGWSCIRDVKNRFLHTCMYHNKSVPRGKQINDMKVVVSAKRREGDFEMGLKWYIAVTAVFTHCLRLSHVCWEAQLMLVYISQSLGWQLWLRLSISKGRCPAPKPRGDNFKPSNEIWFPKYHDRPQSLC